MVARRGRRETLDVPALKKRAIGLGCRTFYPSFEAPWIYKFVGFVQLDKTKEALHIRRNLNPCRQQVIYQSCISQVKIQTNQSSLKLRPLAVKFGLDTLIYRYEGSGRISDFRPGSVN